MYVVVGMVSVYFLTCHIVVSSAVLTKSLHVLTFACLMLLLYSFLSFFHFSLSSFLPVLLYIFRLLFAILRCSVNSSFHHLLLNGLGFFLGVVSSIAFAIACVVSFANLSTFFAVGLSSLKFSRLGRCALIFAFNSFQSVLS